MSATGTRMPLELASRYAEDARALIDGETIVAGSIRRKRADVGDIELLVHVDAHVRLPVHEGLFDGDFETIKGGKPLWKFWQLRHRERDYVLDLYRFDDLNRGSILLIRTGPAQFSQRWVTELRRHGLEHRDGYVRGVSGVWACPSERDAFNYTQWPETPPEDRR